MANASFGAQKGRVGAASAPGAALPAHAPGGGRRYSIRLDKLAVVQVYRLVCERAKRSPRKVAVAPIGPDTLAVRAYFDDGQRDYRYPTGAPLEELPGGFESWPPAPAATKGEHRVFDLPGVVPSLATKAHLCGR